MRNGEAIVDFKNLCLLGFKFSQFGRQNVWQQKALKATFNLLLIAKGVREEIKNNYRILQKKGFPRHSHKVHPSEYEINKGIL